METMKTILAAVLASAGAVAWCAKPDVIPALREWSAMPGVFALGAESRVVIAPGAAEDLAASAQVFADEVGRPLVRGLAREGDVELRLGAIAVSPEAYMLAVTPKGVQVTGATPRAVFWGTRSLLQVLRAHGEFPCGTATDWPDFRARGLLFDCGRKPFTLTTLRQVVDLCAYYKLNELQVHLSDNYIWLQRYGVSAQGVLGLEPRADGFRLESSLPGLTSEDVSYTKEEFRELVAYAAARGVDVIPEIDVPGHALSLVRMRPDLMYKGALTKGKHDCERAAMLDLDNPETFDFVASIFDEYINEGVFPNAVVHIGTDEYYGDPESYRAFADRLCKHIRSRGKTPRMWGSLTHKRGRTPVASEGVQMDIWSLGWQDPVAALNAGFDIVNILDAYTYIVPDGSGSVGAYGDDIDIAKLYAQWNPSVFRDNLKVDPANPKLLGGAWALWCDHSFLTDPGLCGRDLLARIRRNCAIVGLKTWSKEPPVAPLGDFLRTMEANASPVCLQEPQWERTYSVTRTGDAPLKLAVGDETDLWAVSPVNGNVGFRREGAQYTFDYALPEGKPVALTFKATPRRVQLFADGRPVGGAPKRQFHPESCKFYSLPAPERDL